MTQPATPGAAPSVPGARFTEPPFVLPPSVELEEGIVFARPAGGELKLDLFVPRPRQVAGRGVIYLYGGGWRGGTRRQFWRQAAHLASLGCAGACVDYRLVPASIFPAQLEDAQAAVRWLRHEATALGVSPTRIGAVGGSAGGHLAALLGTTDALVDGIPSRVQAGAAFNGVFDLVSLVAAAPGSQPRETVLALLGGDPARAAAASPLHRADTRAAPLLLLHGEADASVPFAQSAALARRLRELGVPVELYAEPGAGHGFFNHPPSFQRTLPVLERFLLAHL